MRQIGRDSETPGKSWGFVILRPPSDFASLNSEFVNHSQGKMMRAGVGVFHETDQRVVPRRVIRGEDATITGLYRLEPATALARRRSRWSAGLKGAQKFFNRSARVQLDQERLVFLLFFVSYSNILRYRGYRP